MIRSSRFARASALLAIALSLPAVARAEIATLPPAALAPGQKATVLTVFEGSRIEPFEAEIVGILDGGRAAGTTILARATSERVVRTGIAQGMSGSPVYVDGKLIGALSSGWSFTREPIFGITPIGEMLDVLAMPNHAEDEASAGPAGAALARSGTGRAKWREFSWPGADLAGPPVALETGARDQGTGHLVPLMLPLASSGLSGQALALAAEWLRPHGLRVVPGGASREGGPAPAAIEPGSAVAIDVLRGDLQLSAIGTATWREGDRVLLFGHPFFQAGEVRMPLSTAEITTIVASDFTSFKLGVRGREAGVVDQDRRAAVGGRIGGLARMLPLRVDITRPGGQQTFRFESIEDRTLAPALVAIATLTGLLESGGTAGNETFEWRARLHPRRGRTLELGDISTGGGPGVVANDLAGPLQYLFDNPFAPLVLDSVVIAVDVQPGRDAWTLREAGVKRAIVRPGSVVRVDCRMARWRGGEVTRDIEVPVPANLPDGTYTIWVGGGRELGRLEAQRFPERFKPESLAEAWTRIAALRSARELYGVLVVPTLETTVDGRDYVGLPPAAASVLQPPPPGEKLRREGAWLGETRLPFEGRVSGEMVVRITVDRSAPVR